MAHIRQQILDAVQSILLTNSSSEWKNVFASRVQPSRAVYPYLSIYLDNETETVLTLHPLPVVQRLLQIAVEGRVRIPNDLEFVERHLNTVAAQVETVLTFQSIKAELQNVKSFYLSSTLIEIDTDDPDRSYGLITLLYEVEVHTTDGNPSTLI